MNKVSSRNAWAESLARDPGRAFDLAFVVFIAAALVLRPTPVWAAVFYGVLVPLFAWSLWARSRSVPATREAWLIGALLAYFATSILWSETASATREIKYFRAVITNGIFIAAAVAFFSRATEATIDRFEKALLAAAALNVAISFAIYFADFDPHRRLTGWAETRHSILGAYVINVCLAVTLDRIRRAQHLDWPLIGLAAAFAAFVVLTRSRAAIAVTFGLFAIAALCLPRQRVMALLVLPALLAIAALGAMAADADWFLREMLARADSYRLMIWEITWDAVQSRPLFGYGLAAEFPLPEPFSQPHNLYLAALYYGGIVGAVLLLALWVSLAARTTTGVRPPDRMLMLCLLVHIVVSGMSDLAQVFKSPSEQWLIIWLPVAMIIGCAGRTAGTAKPGADGMRSIPVPPRTPGDMCAEKTQLRRIGHRL